MRGASGVKRGLHYTIRCWCEESSAEGEYEFKARSQVDAVNLAADQFRDDCVAAAAMYVPPRHRVQTEVIGVRA